MSQPKYPIRITRIPGTTCAVNKIQTYNKKKFIIHNLTLKENVRVPNRTLLI